MLRKETHFELCQRKDFDSLEMKRIQESVGWIEPSDDEDEGWDVNCANEGEYIHCSTQENAEMMSSLETIKHMLFRIWENV